MLGMRWGEHGNRSRLVKAGQKIEVCILAILVIAVSVSANLWGAGEHGNASRFHLTHDFTQASWLHRHSFQCRWYTIAQRKTKNGDAF